jgi:hypothetical protein
MTLLHLHRKDERQNIAKGLGRGRHKLYHPLTKRVEKRTVKPQHNIMISVTCPTCKKPFDRRIDTISHFFEILQKRGWKRNTEDNHLVCPECLKKV